MKTRPLVNTVSDSLLTGKLSPKYANSFAMKTSEWASLALRIIVGPETVGMQICQKCGGTLLQWRQGVMPEWKLIFFFWSMSLIASRKHQLTRLLLGAWEWWSVTADNEAQSSVHEPPNFFYLIFLTEQIIWFNLNWLGISSLLWVKRECPDWKQKRGKASVVLT